MTTGAWSPGYGSRTVTRAVAVARAWWVEILAIALGAVGFVEGLANPNGDGGVSKGPEWLIPLIAPAMALPLLFVRRAPFAAPVATVAVAVAATFVGSGEAVSDSISAFFLLFLAAWLFGQLDRRSAVIGLLLLYLGAIVVNVQGDQNTVGNFFFPALLFTFFWGGSAFLKAREEGFREAEERARRIALANESEATRAVAEERQRIARELHDVIAHSVSVMTVQAGAVRRLLLPEQERERQALETVEATGRQALTEMRRLVGLLREQGAMPEFAPQPSMKTLDVLVGTVREAGLPVELAVEGEPRDLPPGIDLSAYRVVQEALTNALKYAGPARAWVTVRWREQELELEIANDGRSATSEGDGGGHGLAGMSERVSLYGGSIETGVRGGGGFVVTAHLPFEGAS
jgi:signal transduction histidine kinase